MSLAVRFAPQAVPCVTVHRGGRFSYWSDAMGCWIENDTTVPQQVLDTLPADERERVMRALTAAGQVAA
jgi:hypothetical protein